MRIRVRTKEGLQRVGLDQAFGRMIVKYLLGIISFLTVPARADRRAIHDLASIKSLSGPRAVISNKLLVPTLERYAPFRRVGARTARQRR
jgi:hypothetical protein